MKPWYTLQAAGNQAELSIYGVIGKDFWSGEGVGAADFIEDLAALGNVAELSIRINSEGGNVFDGIPIYNALVRHKARKTVTIDGWAASIASLIAMAGDTVIMPENTFLMVHGPSGGVFGNEQEMRAMADALAKVKQGMATTYMSKTGKDEAEVMALLNDGDNWFTAAEAVEFGFADEVTSPVRMAACFDMAKYRNVPDKIVSLVQQPAGHKAGHARRHLEIIELT